MVRLNTILLAAAALAACSAEPGASSEGDAAVAAQEREPLGLMTSMPIYWPDGAAFGTLNDGETQLPWVRTYLEQRYDLAALDTLSADQDALAESNDGADTPAGPLDQFDKLMIIQPRGLSPADNVALDEWVSAGGQLLLALDPLLVGQYAYPLGDPRNPVLSTLIPPVIERWGMSMSFTERQPLEMQTIAYDGGELPMVMSGELVIEPDSASDAECALEADGRIASCVVGEGRVIVMADATIFEINDQGQADEANLQALLDKAFH